MSTEQIDMSTQSPTIVVDYDGFVGRAPDDPRWRSQPKVQHTRMPQHFAWPETGVHDWLLYPGANVIDRAQWEFYASKHRTLKGLIERGEVAELNSLPKERDLTDPTKGLIARTVSHAGLDWIEAQENERKEPRPHVLDAIAQRRTTAHPLPYTTQPHRQPRTFDHRLAEGPPRKVTDLAGTM